MVGLCVCGAACKYPPAKPRALRCEPLEAAMGGHRRIFPKSYAKAGGLGLLPINSIWQPSYAMKKACFSSPRSNCHSNERLRNMLIALFCNGPFVVNPLRSSFAGSLFCPWSAPKTAGRHLMG